MTTPTQQLDCSLTCCCASCKPNLRVYTYKAGDDREGMVHDDKNVKTDDGEMSAACILATSSRDRQGDIIECSGVDFTEHSWNPIVLWDHGRQTNIPIGVTETPKGEYTVIYQPDEDIIVQKTYFAPDKFSTQIYALIKGRFIRANSIAVKDLEVEKLAPDPEAGHFKPGKHILRSALAEVTWTPLPANAEAVASLVTSGRIMGGGFAQETLHPLILKSLTPFAEPRNAWTNGLTVKSQPTTGAGPATEKREKAMADAPLRRKGEDEDGLMEPMDEGNETLHKDVPPGSQHLHDHHDLLMAHKAMLEEGGRMQENPGVKELNQAHADQLEAMAQEVRERHAEEYPDHPAPEAPSEEEKSDEYRDTPEEVGNKERVQRQTGEGNRVEDEKKSGKRKSNISKKAVDLADEILDRTLQRKQAALLALQLEGESAIAGA